MNLHPLQSEFSIDDLKKLKDDLVDYQRPMKASVYASEEPAPFSPFIPTGNRLFTF